MRLLGHHKRTVQSLLRSHAAGHLHCRLASPNHVWSLLPSSYWLGLQSFHLDNSGALTVQDILKVGVGAYGDALKVQRDFGFAMEGVLDLSDFANARLCGNGTAPQKWSLAGG